jgi:hypothetical protein
MARPKKEPALVASVTVTAKLTPAEKAALDGLVADRGARLRAMGTSDDTFAGWLRQNIREQSAAAGRPVEDPVASAPASKRKTKRPARIGSGSS